MSTWTKNEFVYECAMRGFQGSMANPSQHSSIASLVRDAERLWDELQEWEVLQEQKQRPTERQAD